MKHKILKLLPALFTILVAGAVFCVTGKHSGNVSVSGIPAEPGAGALETGIPAEPETSREGIWVHVYGSVVHPGVYFLEKGARAIEAVEMAGGLEEGAQEGALNLAMLLQDGQQIYVPDAEAAAGLAAPEAAADGRININTASREELMTLPGIGEAKAEAIIAYRTQQLFTAVEEIMNVSGIKESSFEKIRERIRV